MNIIVPILVALGVQQSEADVTKTRIERPLKQATSIAVPAESDRSDRPAFSRKRVAAGLVSWHATFDDAVAAADTSGKPVMLFQLLGRLDEEFC